MLASVTLSQGVMLLFHEYGPGLQNRQQLYHHVFCGKALLPISQGANSSAGTPNFSRSFSVKWYSNLIAGQSCDSRLDDDCLVGVTVFLIPFDGRGKGFFKFFPADQEVFLTHKHHSPRLYFHFKYITWRNVSQSALCSFIFQPGYTA